MDIERQVLLTKTVMLNANNESILQTMKELTTKVMHNPCLIHSHSHVKPLSYAFKFVLPLCLSMSWCHSIPLSLHLFVPCMFVDPINQSKQANAPSASVKRSAPSSSPRSFSGQLELFVYDGVATMMRVQSEFLTHDKKEIYTTNSWSSLSLCVLFRGRRLQCVWLRHCRCMWRADDSFCQQSSWRYKSLKLSCVGFE